jgi:hypothetical protein
LGLILGIFLLLAAVGLAPMPLKITLENPTRVVTLYPNLLIAVPMLLLAVLLILYGVVGDNHR